MTGNGEVKGDISHTVSTKQDGGGRRSEGQEGESKLTKNKRGSGRDVCAANIRRHLSWEGLLGVDVKKRAFLRCNLSPPKNKLWGHYSHSLFLGLQKEPKVTGLSRNADSADDGKLQQFGGPKGKKWMLCSRGDKMSQPRQKRLR